MGTRFLILSLGLLLVLPVAAVAVGQRCLECHPSHYAGRGTCTGCHRGNSATVRKNIAHHLLLAGRYARFTLGETADLREGRRLLEQYACRRCHRIGGKGNRLSVSLDRSVLRKAPEELATAILQPVQQMPDFRPGKDRADLLVNALLDAARNSSLTPVSSGPQVVHFDQGGGGNRDVFSQKCGACHRALTARLGGLGRGNSGPNLSGLLSPWYPATFRTGVPWTRERLEQWLQNPRAIRPLATMKPVTLTAGELAELVTVLTVEPTTE